jgi:hypothetical protein
MSMEDTGTLNTEQTNTEGQYRGGEQNTGGTAAAIGSKAVILPVGQTLRQQSAGDNNALPSTPWS